MTPTFQMELNLAVKAANAASDHLRSLDVLVIDREERFDIKLQADREAEAIILETLSISGISVLAEESGEHGRQDGLRWIIDPLDGTVNFYYGLLDLSCVSIALWDGDKPVLGVVSRFAIGELFTGIVGSGAFLNDRPIRVSGTERLDKAMYSSGFPVNHNYTPEQLAEWVLRVRRFKKARMLGSSALMGAFVAAGRLDIYAEDSAKLWDVAAAIALTQAAGGVTVCKPRDNHQCLVRCFASDMLQKELGEIY